MLRFSIAVGVLLAVSGCKKADWKQRPIEELGIAVRLPEAPRRVAQPLKTPTVKGLEAVSFETRAGQAEYMAFQLDYSAVGQPIDTDLMLRGSVNGFLGSANTEQMELRPSSLGEYLGAELIGPVPKGGTLAFDAFVGARIFVRKDKERLVGIIGIAPIGDKETVVSFLDSLTFNP